MNIRTRLAALAAVLSLLTPALHAQVPQLVNYQGRVAVGTVNFNGSGAFKFALVNAAGTTTYWSNDGTSTAGSQPTAAVALTVTKGLYSVLLGDTSLAGMTSAIPASVWTNPHVRLRVWFNDGTNGSQLLTPDQRLAPNGYLPDGSVSAAALASGAVTSTKIANGAVGSTQIAAGAVQSANIAAGAVANAQLANSAITINAGSGLGGGGTPALGGSVTLSNAGVLSLTGGGGISVSAGTGAITLGSNATPFNNVGTLVLRDENGGFSAGAIDARAVNLPSTINPNAGLITQNGTRLLHTFGTRNVFVGEEAGNFSMSGFSNIGIGYRALAANTTGRYNAAGGDLALSQNTTGESNTAFGYGTLFANTTGFNNTALGQNSMGLNVTGSGNSASGYVALQFNTTGSENTAHGAMAMLRNTTGAGNTASGYQALQENTTASRNVAIGHSALVTQAFSNGGVAWNSDNVAVGFEALRNNQPTGTSNGRANTALGTQALRANTTGAGNTASGFQALFSNTIATDNTASGFGTLFSNTTGSSNTASGSQALVSNTAAGRNVAMGHLALFTQSFNNGGVAWNSNNVAVGFEALYSNQPTETDNGDSNTAVGTQALRSTTTGEDNTASGYQALYSNTTGSGNTAIGFGANVDVGNRVNATAIGYGAIVDASNKVRIGNASVTVIQGQVNFTASSDRTKKENFQPVDGAEVLRKIREFKLTSWNFIGHDPKQFRHYGPMAQDFYAAFGQDAVGAIGTPTTINSGDLSGILMSAVQALAKENAALKAQLAGREARDRERDERIARLERLLPATPAGQKAGLQTASTTPAKP